MRGAYLGLFAAIGALSAYLPLYYEARGLTIDVIGLIAALYAGVAMLGAPAWGIVADVLGARAPTLAAAAAGAGLSAVWLAFASEPIQIATGAALVAVSMSGIMPLLDARAAKAASGTGSYARARVWGSIAFIGSVLLTGWLTDGWGAVTMFGVVIPALGLTAAIGYRLRPTVDARQRWRREAVSSLVRSRPLLTFLGAIFLTWTSSTTVNAFFSLHLVDVGAPRWVVGIAWAIGAAVEVPIMLAYARLERRFGLSHLLMVGAMLLALRAAAVVATSDPTLLALTMAIHGAGFALLIVGGVLYAARLAPPNTAATVQGLLVAIVFGLAQVVGPGIGGQVAAVFGLPTTFAVAGAGSVVAVLVLHRPTRAAQPLQVVRDGCMVRADRRIPAQRLLWVGATAAMAALFTGWVMTETLSSALVDAAVVGIVSVAVAWFIDWAGYVR